MVLGAASYQGDRMVFRSLFWRIFATFWLAILSAVGLTMLLGHLATTL